jgi:hypothetical protein
MQTIDSLLVLNCSDKTNTKGVKQRFMSEYETIFTNVIDNSISILTVSETRGLT